jgi:hypothetical protein
MLALFNEVWQSLTMGNKDARGREKKKPKKKEIKREEIYRPAPPIVREAPKS